MTTEIEVKVLYDECDGARWVKAIPTGKTITYNKLHLDDVLKKGNGTKMFEMKYGKHDEVGLFSEKEIRVSVTDKVPPEDIIKELINASG